MARVIAVMVSHDAPAGIAARIAAVRAQVEALVVVDNGSCQVKLQELDRAVHLEGVHLIRNRNNDGLARALNQGLAWARAQGADWTLLLDHDSEPCTGMVERMLDAARTWRRPLAVIVPRVEDAEVKVPWRWLRSPKAFLPWFGFAYAAQEPRPLAVDFAIGSGMLVNKIGRASCRERVS
jgi:rhamnosyltransferase